MQVPLVSILVPCYNAAQWLGATLESARGQTWPRCETIVVDDGSSDGSCDIAARYAGPDLTLVCQSNAGPSAALNRALGRARGDYIQYLDADDLLAPDKIAVQMRRLEGMPEGWIASGAWARFASDPGTAVFTSEAVWHDRDPVDWLATSWSGGGMMPNCAWLVPHRVIDAAGPWDERLTLINDFEYFTRVLLASEGAAFCPDARVYYRSGTGASVSRRSDRRAWMSAFLATDLGTRRLLEREDSERTRRAAAMNWQRFAYAAYPFTPDLVRRAQRDVHRLGGSDLQMEGGPAFRTLKAAFGWKVARRAQVAAQRLRAG